MPQYNPTRREIVFPGGGIFFWWQAGAVKALQECVLLDHCTFSGASAGSLSAVFAACNVDTHNAFQVAHRLADERKIWEGPQGLACIWGSMIEAWLKEVLPENAAELCESRVSLSVTCVRPSLIPLKRRQVSSFKTRDDVIQACMTSVHIPFFIDGNALRDFQGETCVDGALLFFLQGIPWCFEENEPPAFLCYHGEDQRLMSKQWGFLDTISPEAFEEMFQLGYSYVTGLAAAGRLDLLSSSAHQASPHTEGYEHSCCPSYDDPSNLARIPVSSSNTCSHHQATVSV
jgi:hypothetical protein